MGNKAESLFRSEKLKGREQALKPGNPKSPEPTAQVLPYDFRPGNLNIFGEINDKDKIQDLKNIDNVPQDDFKYESETDLESIVKVPSEYSSGVNQYDPQQQTSESKPTKNRRRMF